MFSAWQGEIDWKKVADVGTEFAIIRITEAGNNVDAYFERNYNGCVDYGIPAGVYKFSYALSVAAVDRKLKELWIFYGNDNYVIQFFLTWNTAINAA